MDKTLRNRERQRRFILLLAHYKDHADAAEKLELGSPGYVSNLKTGQKTMGEQTARKIEKNANLPVGVLLDPMNTPWIDDSDLTGVNNIENVKSFQHIVPVLDWHAANMLTDQNDLTMLRNNIEYVAVYKKHSNRTFGLRVKGDSMLNSTAPRPSYYEGDIVVCDCELAGSAKSGDRVIARLLDDSLPEDDRLTFKQLIVDGGNRYLKSLNTSYQPILSDFQIIAVVINVVSE